MGKSERRGAASPSNGIPSRPSNVRDRREVPTASGSSLHSLRPLYGWFARRLGSGNHTRYTLRHRCVRLRLLPPHLRNRSSSAAASAPPPSSSPPPRASPGLLGHPGGLGSAVGRLRPGKWDREPNPFGNEDAAVEESARVLDEHQNTGINFDAYEDMICSLGCSSTPF